MTKSSLALLTFVFCSAPAVTLIAQEPQELRRHLIRGPSPLFIALDLDRDGVISTEEIARGPESLAALDHNGDGTIRLDEIFDHRHMRLRGPEGENLKALHLRLEKRSGPPEGAVIKIREAIFNAIDADGDGVLSAGEISNAWSSLLDLDADQDGQLTVEEVHPLRPGWGSLDQAQ